MSRERERELLRTYASGHDSAPLDELIAAHMPMVRSIVRRCRARAVRDEDLVAEGVVGLIEAARRFDPDYDARFATYAAHWVRAKVRYHVQRYRRIVAPLDTRASRRILGGRARVDAELRQRLGRMPTDEEIAAALGVHASEYRDVGASYDARDVALGGTDDGGTSFACQDAEPTIEELVAEQEESTQRSAALARAIANLPVREQEIVRRRRLSLEPPPLETLAREMRISRERVRQLELRGLAMLARAFGRAARVQQASGRRVQATTTAA